MDIVRFHIPDCKLHVIANVEPDLMPLYYRAADVLVCASTKEGSPNVVKEALACNLPVVSTPVGDVRERLAGVYPSEVVPREPNEMGKALARILLERKRSNGREHIAQLGLDQVAQRVLEVYQTVLGASDDTTLDRRSPVIGTSHARDGTVIPIEAGEMVREVVKVHREAFGSYLNSFLGGAYIRKFITWFIHKEDAIAIAAVDHNQRVVGYAVGAPVGYGTILNRELVWVAFAGIALHPWICFRPFFWQTLRARLLTFLQRPSSTLSCCELPEPRMSLVAIGVAGSWRRRGIGLRLMQTFMAKARELKMRSLTLCVRRDQTAARKFYEKCGWRPCSSVTMKGDVLKYCRPLDQAAEEYLCQHQDHSCHSSNLQNH
jgi:ribosomal protein S18 acetylase RimI-like enzyme